MYTCWSSNSGASPTAPFAPVSQDRYKKTSTASPLSLTEAGNSLSAHQEGSAGGGHRRARGGSVCTRHVCSVLSFVWSISPWICLYTAQNMPGPKSSNEFVPKEENLELRKGGRENCILCVADVLPGFSHSLHNKTNAKTKQTTS